VPSGCTPRAGPPMFNTADDLSAPPARVRGKMRRRGGEVTSTARDTMNHLNYGFSPSLPCRRRRRRWRSLSVLMLSSWDDARGDELPTVVVVDAERRWQAEREGGRWRVLDHKFNSSPQFPRDQPSPLPVAFNHHRSSAFVNRPPADRGCHLQYPWSRSESR